MLNLNHIEFSTPQCPDIILDGNQLILRLDATQERHPTPICNEDLQKHKVLCETATNREYTIGSFRDWHLPEMASVNDLHPEISNPVEVQAVSTDLLEKYFIRSSQTMDTGAIDFLMPEMIPSATQADNEPAPTVDFAIGEQVITVTQQVPITFPKQPLSNLAKVSEIVLSLPCSHLGLVCALVLYTFIGAAIFDALEDFQCSAFSDIIQSNKSTPDNLQKAFFTLRNKQFDKGDSVILTVNELSNLLVEYEGILRQMPQLHFLSTRACQTRQEYWKWFLFCITVYTTIGKFLNRGICKCIIIIVKDLSDLP